MRFKLSINPDILKGSARFPSNALKTWYVFFPFGLSDTPEMPFNYSVFEDNTGLQ